MGAPHILDELQSLTKYQPSYGGMPPQNLDVCIVADVLDFTTVGFALVGGSSQTTTLARKPAGSTATVSANAFTADLPGRYDVTVAVAGVTKTYSVYAFPAAFLTTRVNTDPSGQSTPAKTLTRAHLRAFVAAPAGVPTAALTTLETAAPAPTISLLGPITNVAPLQSA